MRAPEGKTSKVLNFGRPSRRGDVQGETEAIFGAMGSRVSFRCFSRCFSNVSFNLILRFAARRGRGPTRTRTREVRLRAATLHMYFTSLPQVLDNLRTFLSYCSVI